MPANQGRNSSEWKPKPEFQSSYDFVHHVEANNNANSLEDYAAEVLLARLPELAAYDSYTELQSEQAHEIGQIMLDKGLDIDEAATEYYYGVPSNLEASAKIADHKPEATPMSRREIIAQTIIVSQMQNMATGERWSVASSPTRVDKSQVSA